MNKWEPGCATCHVPRCSRCRWEKVQVVENEQKQALYTWNQDAALPENAALLGLTGAEPHILQPPGLTNATTPITCTTLEPDPTYDNVGLQQGLSHSILAEKAILQSLNEQSLQHRQPEPLASPTITPRQGFGLSPLSSSPVDSADIAPDPYSLASSIPNQVQDRPSPLPRQTARTDKSIAAFHGWRAEGSKAFKCSSSTTSAAPLETSQPSPSRGTQRSHKRTSNQSSNSKQGGAKRTKVSITEPRQPRKECKRLLACPFWKKDSIRHRDCFKGVKRIRDVKQHLRRNHLQPVFCPRCGMEFGDQDAELRNHMRAAKQCENRSFPEPAGITSLHQKALKRYSDRGADEAEQWFVIWDHLFPGGPNGEPPPRRPVSPYVDHGASEDVSALREYANREGWKRLATCSDPDLNGLAFHVDEELFQKMFEWVCEGWQAERSASSHHFWEESPPARPDTRLSTPDETAPSSGTSPIHHKLREEDIMTLSDFSAHPDSASNFFGSQIDGTFDDFMAMPSMDNNTAQMFPSIPLLNSEPGIEHAIPITTLDPALISS